MFKKLRRRIGALLFKCLQIPKPAVFIDKSVLIEFFFRCFSRQTSARHIFHIDLYPLSGIGHFLIWLGDVFRIRQLDGLSVNPAQETIQPGDGSGISPLAQLYPKYYQTRMRVSAAHVFNKGNLFFCMLLWMTVGSMRAVCQRTHRSVIFLSPTVDILSAGFVANRCPRHTVFQRIFYYCLLIPHILCYLIHSG